jgi:urea transport system permease protein
MPEGWTFMLGAMFVCVTIFMPKGLAGLLQRKLAPKKSASPPPPPLSTQEVLP